MNTDLIKQIQEAQKIAGEQVVINSLKEKGLVEKGTASEESSEFFNLFREVRSELCKASATETYYLETAIRIAFDRWSQKTTP